MSDEKPRILIVEHDEDQLFILATLLVRDFEGAVARNGLEALDKIPHVEPDLFIIAGELPHMDGWQFMLKLRESQEFRRTPIVFISTVSDRRTVESTYRLGVALYLVKPIRPDMLLPMIERVTRERRLQTRKKKYKVNEFPHLLAPREEPKPQEQTQGGGVSVKKGPRPGMRRRRIMIVDDDPDVHAVIRLKMRYHYSIDSCYDGKDALDRAMRSRPDVLVIDWMIPRLAGPQLIRALRRAPGFDKTPIVLISAKALSDQEKAMEGVHVDACLAKPLDLVQLTEWIEARVDPFS